MKKIIYTIIAALSFNLAQAQIHNFSDTSILFSQSEVSGTARFTGLSGAMGALGGDISTTQVNPAGLGVFNHHEFSVGLSTDTKNSKSTYFGNTVDNTNYDGDFDHIGLALVIEQNYTDWKKVVLGFNYQLIQRFDNIISSQGNSGFASFNQIPDDNSTALFDNAEQQIFTNETIGSKTQFTASVASQYKDNFYIGGAINFKKLDYVQKTELQEINTNNNNEELDVLYNQYDSHIADGVSLNVGILYKVSPAVRLGLAYESPTWFTETLNENNTYDHRFTDEVGRVNNENFNGNVDILVNGNKAYDKINNELESLNYSLKTPNKFIVSSALVLGKTGLLSLDYTYKNYNALKLSSNSEIVSVAEHTDYFKNTLKNTHNFNAGAEIRIQQLSLRGGLSYQESPFEDGLRTHVIRLGDQYGASLGAGLRFGNHKIDASYAYSQQTNSYDFYDKYEQVTAAQIENKRSRVNITYSYLF